MKKLIKKAFDEQLAHDKNDVLENILNTPVEKIDDLDMVFQENKSKFQQHRLRYVSTMLVAACAILLFSLNSLGIFNKEHSTLVSLDVNPGFQFIVNDDNKVEELIALNDEAKELLEDRNYHDWGLEEVVESLVISLCKNNYITLEKNSVLVLTEDDDNKRSNDINKIVNDTIVKVLNQFEINGNIVLKTTKMDDSLEKIAKNYNVSVGKMKLINEIIDKKDYQIDELVDLSISELLALLNDNLTPINTPEQPNNITPPVPSNNNDNDDDHDDDDRYDNDNDDIDDDNNDDDNDDDNDDNSADNDDDDEDNDNDDD